MKSLEIAAAALLSAFSAAGSAIGGAAADAAAGAAPLIVSQNGKFGFISSTDGHLLAAPRYARCGFWREGFAWVQEEERPNAEGGFVGTDGQLITRQPLHDLAAVRFEMPVPGFRSGIAVAGLPDGGFGYVNAAGRIIGRTSRAGAFMRQDDTLLLSVAGEGSPVGFIDRTGTTRIPPRFAEATPFRGGRAAVRTETKWGLIDEEGALVAPPEFDAARWFADEPRCWAFRLDDKWGLLDRDGKRLTEAVFETFGVWHGDALSIGSSNLWGLISIEGATLVAPRYGVLQPLGSSSGTHLWAAQGISGLWGIIATNGVEKVACRYSGVASPAPGVFLARVDGLSGVLDLESGALIGEARYARILPLEAPLEKIALIERRGRWGLLDLTTGKELIALRLDSLRQHGALLLGQDGEAALWLDHDGRQVAPPEEAADPAAWLPSASGGRWGYSDAKGKVVVAPRFEAVERFHGDIAAAREGGKWGLIGRDGQWRVPPAYDELGTPWRGLVPARRGTGWGLVGADG